ncbi:MAG: DUF2235 domain-containing protein [Paracoccaceae bacterium]
MTAPLRNARVLVYIVDGTLSRLDPGRETHAGAVWKLLAGEGPRSDRLVAYHPGVQGAGAGRWWRAIIGEGVNDAICAGYGFLSSRWRPGDRILLFGYSRGAYAVRSLAGMIGRVGLLHPEAALDRRVRRAFRHYERWPSRAGRIFSRAHCRTDVEIEMLGVWDTVRSLGLPYPLLSRLHPAATEFHDHALGPQVRAGYHALAVDEDRTAFRPVMWRCDPDWHGRLEQRWFPGAHGDVGGEIGDFAPARPLANVALVWMLERAAHHGLPLPVDWRDRFPVDAAAPMCGTRRGIGRGFLFRRPRRVGASDGEDLHPAVAARMQAVPGYVPRAQGLEV